ncbi:MAG: peptide-methionine (S)-S-oxide reductase [Bdellovibrionales bacterium RIFCSPHIGHO2_01_FULL_40_29]|nr:MAG: peptide-methionine (S)-S-oxide reductase [Bdellovibrionales bacterium RIFCSPHIGHO2_01_FULL_40_29]OFZ35615.1 MAG: peptide-methionine (S)-S-oxide reductase [Bdellovibrionales bacterium RIFCSPHIGHO2_02_FULL_40_15]
MEKPFEELVGVLAVTSGYTGGHVENPSYEQVSSGATGHIESVEVVYDSSQISLEKILEVYWINIDPFDGNGQFCDKGYQYTSALFYSTDAEKELFQKSWAQAQRKLKISGTLKTNILPAKTFFKAEDYHQDYYKKNPIRYRYYRSGCGRDKRLQQVWNR